MIPASIVNGVYCPPQFYNVITNVTTPVFKNFPLIAGVPAIQVITPGSPQALQTGDCYTTVIKSSTITYPFAIPTAAYTCGCQTTVIGNTAYVTPTPVIVPGKSCNYVVVAGQIVQTVQPQETCPGSVFIFNNIIVKFDVTLNCYVTSTISNTLPTPTGALGKRI